MTSINVNTTLILHSPGLESVFRIIQYIFIPEKDSASYTVHSHGLISWSSLNLGITDSHVVSRHREKIGGKFTKNSGSTKTLF